MSYRVILYCLEPDQSGKTVLSYKLNSEGIIVSNDLEKVVVKLNGKLITLFKSRWMNKVYDDGKTTFFMATKQIRTEYIFETLMKYALTKIDVRIEFLQTMKSTYQKELNSLKLKAA